MPTFTIMGSGIGYIGGNYKNDVPYLAAKKAGKALFKKLENPKYAKHKKRKSIKFVIRMKDRHGPGKTYAYQVIKEKLKKPILIKVKNTEYYVKFNYVIKACDLSKKEKKILLGGNFIGGMENSQEVEPELDEPESDEPESDEPEPELEPESDESGSDEPEPTDTNSLISGGKKKKKKGGNECVQENIVGGKKKKKKGGFFGMSTGTNKETTANIPASSTVPVPAPAPPTVPVPAPAPTPVNPTSSGGKNKKKGGNNQGFDPDENKYSSIEGGKKKGTKK